MQLAPPAARLVCKYAVHGLTDDLLVSHRSLDKRVGLTPLLGAVDRCLPDVVKYLLADSRVDVRLTTMGKGIQKIGDLPCSLLLVAGLAYLNRRTTESQKIFGMVCRRP